MKFKLESLPQLQSKSTGFSDEQRKRPKYIGYPKAKVIDFQSHRTADAMIEKMRLKL